MQMTLRRGLVAQAQDLHRAATCFLGDLQRTSHKPASQAARQQLVAALAADFEIGGAGSERTAGVWGRLRMARLVTSAQLAKKVAYLERMRKEACESVLEQNRNVCLQIE